MELPRPNFEFLRLNLDIHRMNLEVLRIDLEVRRINLDIHRMNLEMLRIDLGVLRSRCEVLSLAQWDGFYEEKADSPFVKMPRIESHPYEAPEIICIKIEKGLPDYLRWVANCGDP